MVFAGIREQMDPSWTQVLECAPPLKRSGFSDSRNLSLCAAERKGAFGLRGHKQVDSFIAWKIEDLRKILLGAVGIESTDCMETKEFCGAAWPSKILKGKKRNS
jgi:hypothetical protein